MQRLQVGGLSDVMFEPVLMVQLLELLL